MKNIFIIFFLLTVSTAHAEYLVIDNFNAYSTVSDAQVSGWGFSGNATLLDDGGVDGACIAVNYATNNWVRATYQMGGAWPEGYIGFYTKLVNKQNSFPKFLKFFGATGVGYANWTLHSGSYSSAVLNSLYHGTGTDLDNDNACKHNWRLGTAQCGAVMNYASADEFTWPDENWHHVVVYWKLNTNGNSDGAYKVWIDDELKMDVSNVVNRNDLNTRGFNYFALGEWTDDTILASVEPYYVLYDNVVVASSYAEISNAFSDPTPNPTPATSGPILRTGTHLLRVGDSVLRVQ